MSWKMYWPPNSNLMASFDDADIVGKLRVRACGRVAGIAVNTADRKTVAQRPHRKVNRLTTAYVRKIDAQAGPVVEVIGGSGNPGPADLCAKGVDDVGRDQVGVPQCEGIDPVGGGVRVQRQRVRSIVGSREFSTLVVARPKRDCFALI